MKTLITAILISVFALTSSLAFADKPMDNKADTAWMYVLVSEKGKIARSDDGYALII